jgi:hypothetical protein
MATSPLPDAQRTCRYLGNHITGRSNTKIWQIFTLEKRDFQPATVSLLATKTSNSRSNESVERFFALLKKRHPLTRDARTEHSLLEIILAIISYYVTHNPQEMLEDRRMLAEFPNNLPC